MFLSLAMLSHPVRANDAPQLQALVYRGEAACEGCPEAVAQLLETSAYHFNVTFCGPDEAVDISPEILAHAAVYAYPGGPGKCSITREREKQLSSQQLKHC